LGTLLASAHRLHLHLAAASVNVVAPAVPGL
jgi:hypothetical protein